MSETRTALSAPEIGSMRRRYEAQLREHPPKIGMSEALLGPFFCPCLDCAEAKRVLSLLDELVTLRGAAETAGPQWRSIESAPKDGRAVLGFGLHSGPQPDAQRGVKAGDYWWAIMLWDIWRAPENTHGWGESSRWVFAKDGKPAWSMPTHWTPLPAPPASLGTDAQETEP